MKKKVLNNYESPLTLRTQVALESGICAGSSTVTNPNEKDFGRIEEQSVNSGFSSSFESEGWD